MIEEYRNEAAKIALELYELNSRKESLEKKMGEIKIIIATAEHIEKQAVENKSEE